MIPGVNAVDDLQRPALPPSVFSAAEKIWGRGRVAAAHGIQRGPQGREHRVCIDIYDAERDAAFKVWLLPAQVQGGEAEALEAIRNAVKGRTDSWDKGRPENQGSRAAPKRGRGRPRMTDNGDA